MIRSDVLKTLIPMISEELVISNIGLPSQELHLLDDQPTNFYMLGTMGLSSSIGLGLALAQKQKVIAIDGDKMTIIVSKCESGNIEVPVIDMDAPVIRHRFMAEVSRRNA